MNKDNKLTLAVRTPANQMATAETIDVDLYGVVTNDAWYDDEFGINKVLKALEGLKPDQTINLHINSVGGMVSEGVTIYNRLKALPNNKIVIVEGLAASIASVIAMAGDTVHMALGSQMMIHNPSTITMGDSAEMRRAAEMLDSTKESIIDIYTERTNMGRDDLSALMDAETWLTAKEALDKGFCDTIDDSLQMLACKCGSDLVVNGIPMAVDVLRGLPIDKYNVADEPPKGEEMELTLDILKADYADIYNAAVEEGRKAERERMQALDALNTAERAAIINKAKYDTLQNAQDVAIELLQVTATPTSHLDGMIGDANEASNKVRVPTVAPTPEPPNEQDRANQLIDKVFGGAK